STVLLGRPRPACRRPGRVRRRRHELLGRVMTDPRKPVQVPEHQQLIRAIVHRHLLDATAEGARELGTTGASFVMVGMGVWAAELSELDGNAAAAYLRSLAVLFDPRATENQKRRAERERAQAVRKIF